MKKRIYDYPIPTTHPDQWRTHDSEERQEQERAVIQRYCEQTNAGGYEQKGIGSRYDADIFTRDRALLREIVEVKTRRQKRTATDYFPIDIAKVVWLKKRARENGVPAMLVVAWADGLTRINLSFADPTSWAVREYRNPRRQEFADLQYLIPVQEMERIK